MIALPLVGGLAVAMASAELKGYLLRRAQEICQQATSALPEPEASERAEEWAAHILDMDQEPIRAFITAKRYRKDAWRIATELDTEAFTRPGMWRKIGQRPHVGGVLRLVRVIAFKLGTRLHELIRVAVAFAVTYCMYRIAHVIGLSTSDFARSGVVLGVVLGGLILVLPRCLRRLQR